MDASLVSLICLLITGGLAGWAVFSQHYDDTVIQRLGLSLVAIASVARAAVRLGDDPPPPPPPELLMAQIGLALYAIGTALRIWQASHRQPERRRHGRRRGEFA
jgi:hypothetical protein